MSTCKACGYRGELKAIGRMGQYVLKNAPEKFAVGEKAMYDKDRNASDEKPATGKPSPSRQVDGWEDDDTFALNTDDNARMDRALKDLDSLMAGLTLGVEELVENMDTGKKYELFVKHCKRVKKEKGEDFPGCSAEVNCLRDTLQLSEGQAVWAYCSGFLKWTDEEKKISEKKFIENLKKFSGHLKALCDIEHSDGEKSQRMMLGVVETVIYNNKKKCLPYTAHILKQLYDDDILEDSTILKWAEKPSKKFVKKIFVEKMVAECTKFLDWLKEDDSDDEGSSSEEEESEDEEVVEKQETSKNEESSKEESSKEEIVMPKIENKKPVAVAMDSDSDDDIDIDDI